MTTERLFLNHDIQQAVKAARKRTKRRQPPEQVLCNMLNRLSPQQRQAVAERLR